MDLLKVSLLHGLYGRWKKHKGQMHHPLVAYFHLGDNEYFGRNSQLGTVQEQRIICCELICNSNTQRNSFCIVECFDCYLGAGFLLLKVFWFVCHCVVFFSPVCVWGGSKDQDCLLCHPVSPQSFIVFIFLFSNTRFCCQPTSVQNSKSSCSRLQVLGLEESALPHSPAPSVLYAG